MSEKAILTQNDSYKTEIEICRTEKECKGSVVILHGMQEHHARYYPFKDALNEAGYDVYMYDHRGHGLDKEEKELGFFANHKGYDRVVTDAIDVIKYVKTANRGKKTFVFSHSMGSIITRNVIQRYDEMDGVILCGTAAPEKSMAGPGMVLANIVTFFTGPHKKGKFLDNMMFGTPTYKSVCKDTKVDWLSRDKEIVEKYIADPYCGFPCTNSMLRDLDTMTYRGVDEKRVTKTRKDLPLYIVSGEGDPVGDFGKAVKKLEGIYSKYGYEKVTTKLYPDCRHELLNELNNKEITENFIAFYESI